MKKKAKVIFYHLEEDKTCILLGKRILSSFEEFWWLPGGSVESGESLLQALVRELNEELFLTPTLMQGFEKFNEYSHPPSVTYSTESSEVTIFMIRVDAMEEGIRCKEEFTEMKWFDVSLLPVNMSREFPHVQFLITSSFLQSITT